MESARETIEKKIAGKKVDASPPPAENTLEKAFSRLEKAVEAQSGSRSVSGVAGVSGVGAKGDRTAYGAIDLYNVELMYRIRQNWAFNERLANAEKGIQARVLIKILQNGQIRDVWFETRSGNRYLDESALKAVKKSNPLPPLPKGYVTYDVGLQFTPSGLK
jgi:colicin import membrane protein